MNTQITEETRAEEIHTADQETLMTRGRKFAQKEIHDLAEGTGKIVIFDFIVGFLFIFRAVAVAGMPLGTLVLLLYVFLRFTIKPKRIVPRTNLFLVIMILAFFYVVVVSVSAGESGLMDSLQRAVRMMSIVGLAFLMGDGRTDLKSIVLGFASGLVFNAVGFYAGVAPADYGSFLTGWIQDKNVAGLYYALIPLMMYVLYTKPWQRMLLPIVALPLLWETGSRTSMGAFIIGGMWLLFARRLNLFFKMIFGGFAGWLFEWLQTNFASSSAFGDRTGTDWFRQQIDKASWTKVTEAPWHGFGLGQAYAPVPGHNNQFFHNSYWTLYVEGGWPWVIAILGMTLCVVFIWRQPQSPRAMGAEASMVLLAVCSWRLGEVILTAPWGLVMGMALFYISRPLNHSLYLGDRQVE